MQHIQTRPSARPYQTVQRLFFAAFPAAQDATPIHDMAREHNRTRELGGYPLKASRLHVTLDHVGDFGSAPAAIVDFAIRVGDQVARSCFEATFTRTESFRGQPGRHPYVLRGDEGLGGFHFLRNAIWGAYAWLGRDVRSTSYSPHMTLLYGKREATAMEIPPLTWRVSEFALVLSHVGETRYDILAKWPLKTA